MSSSAGPVVSVENLTKHFYKNTGILSRLDPLTEKQTIHAVDDVSLDIESGEVRALVGESGCGKSTLARCLLRLIEPTAGTVTINDVTVTDLSDDELRRFRKQAQIIFQDPGASLNPRFSVQRIIRAPMATHGIGTSRRDRDERVVDLLEQVGLSAEFLNRYPSGLSGGQAQRVAIARALSVEPDILIADEPTSALDASVQAQILNLIRELQAERDLTILFISHDLSVVRYISDKVSVMYLGQIVESTETARMFEDPKHPYTQALFSSIPSPDPHKESGRIRLEGSVPEATDPPIGCRFHTRCPKIIPPADWDGTQEAWTAFFNLRSSIEHRVLDDERERRVHIDPKSVIETRFDDELHADLDPQVAQVVADVRTHLESEDYAEALESLQLGFETPCVTTSPELHESGPAHQVSCHLYTDVSSHGPQQEAVHTGSD